VRDSEGGAGDGACGGFTDLYSLSFEGSAVVTSLGSPVGWELVRLPVGRGAKSYAARQTCDPPRNGPRVPQAVIDGASEISTPAAAGGGVQVQATPVPTVGTHDTLRDPDECGSG
jgi:hypothetical protein